MVEEELRTKLVRSLCVSSFFGLTLFFFGPLYLYYTNNLEFSSPFLSVCPFFLPPLFLFILFSTVFLFALKISAHQKVISLLLVLSFLLWLQGTIIVWKYGPLDGSAIDWRATVPYGLIDGSIWLIFLGAAFVFSLRIWKIAQRASIALILTQIVASAIIVYQAPDASGVQRKLLSDEESIYKFSEEKNVVILVLDQFQGDVFQEIISESLHYRDMVDGATYYRNALAAYPHTYASLSVILTGQFYENSMPLQEFIRHAFSGESLPRILKQRGYHVDLIGGGKSIYADETIASNRVELKYLVEQNAALKEAAFAFDLTLFRYLPHFAKKYVYNNQAWFISNLGLHKKLGEFPAGKHRDSIEFMKKLARTAKVGSDRSTFKYIHLAVPHLPVRLNERLEYVELNNTRENYKNQAKGALNLVDMFLGRLKYIGAYDTTMLFIIADHGAGGKVETHVMGEAARADQKAATIDEMVKGSALPLFLIKPFGSRGKLTISDAPVSLADIPKTISSELGLEADFTGISILDAGEAGTRDRRFLYHRWTTHDLQRYRPYLPPMEEYVVSGPSWLDESWHPTRRVFTPTGTR